VARQGWRQNVQQRIATKGDREKSGEIPDDQIPPDPREDGLTAAEQEGGELLFPRRAKKEIRGTKRSIASKTVHLAICGIIYTKLHVRLRT